MTPTRRSFLIGTSALICAPAIVRASSLMKVRVRVIDPPDYWFTAWGDILNSNFETIAVGYIAGEDLWMGDVLRIGGDEKLYAIRTAGRCDNVNAAHVIGVSPVTCTKGVRVPPIRMTTS